MTDHTEVTDNLHRGSVIVLDLDLTLLCTDHEDDSIPYRPLRMHGDKPHPLVRRSHMYSFHLFGPTCERECTMYGCFRPGYRQFLHWARKNFDYVVVWSAGRRAYVHELVTKIWKGMKPPDLVMTFNDLGLNGDIYTKPLVKVSKLLNTSLDQILLIDDNPQVSVDNPNNTVLIPEYDPASEDRELWRLIEMLEERKIWESQDYASMGLRNMMREEPVVDRSHYQVLTEE